MTDAEIRNRFEGASDFEMRKLSFGEHYLYAYFIDGLVSGSFIADYTLAVEAMGPTRHLAI